MADYKDIITGTISNIVGKVKEAAESPSVQQAVGKVKEAAGDTVSKVKEAAEGSTVKEVYEQGASRVKSYGRIAKLSLQVNGEYEELRRVYTEIGKLCYDRHKDAPEELFAPLFSQVEEIGSRIKSMEDEIEAVKVEVSGAGDDGDITVEVVAEPVDEAAERAAEYRAAAEDFQAVVDAETDGENKD
ncbi:MAG TPA: hypothetical protein IAC00_07435 [Candidatus Limivicinus faecipullorum]|nr:hypothetical protein [Candidatus Limivicinus faecipullorum]